MDARTHLRFTADPHKVLFKPSAISVDALIEIHKFKLLELKRLVENAVDVHMTPRVAIL